MSEVNPRQGRLACIYFFAMAGLVIGNLMGRIPALKEQTQLDERALGQALLGVGVGALTAFPLSGFLVQRIGSRSVVIGGCLIMLLVFPLLGLSQGWWQLALAFYVLGVSFAGMDVAMNIQAVDVERLLGKDVAHRFLDVKKQGFLQRLLCFGGGVRCALRTHGVWVFMNCGCEVRMCVLRNSSNFGVCWLL